jgi:hypothetical protein
MGRFDKEFGVTSKVTPGEVDPVNSGYCRPRRSNDPFYITESRK